MRVQGNAFQDSFIFFTHTGDLTCGREIGLSWCNVDTLRISVAVTGKDLPECYEWMPCPLITSPGDFIETNEKLFLQFEAEEQKHGTVSLGDTDKDKCAKQLREFRLAKVLLMF